MSNMSYETFASLVNAAAAQSVAPKVMSCQIGNDNLTPLNVEIIGTQILNNGWVLYLFVVPSQKRVGVATANGTQGTVAADLWSFWCFDYTEWDAIQKRIDSQWGQFEKPKHMETNIMYWHNLAYGK
jgi:hypothetical protein